ncbi:unnamed protein product [Closterium sp. NIES-53]
MFVYNKAMIPLRREPRLKSRVKHIELRHFMLQELQQRSQARLVFEASKANTVDIFTKALVPANHHMFCSQFGIVQTCPRLL